MDDSNSPSVGADDTDSADMGSGAPEPAGDTDQAQGQIQGDTANTIHVAAADLPSGVDPVAGTKVMFCITGPPDAENDVPGYFETSSEDGAADKGTSWEADFRKSMSPRSGGSDGDQEAQ
jgi:hypothetical protein